MECFVTAAEAYVQTTMSQYYRGTIRSFLIRDLFEIERTQRNLDILIECEHPDWGEPWAEEAHEAAVNAIRDRTRTADALSNEEIRAIRQRNRKSMQIPVTDMQPHPQETNGVSKVARTLYLKPSAHEATRQAAEASLEVRPEEVPLPDNDNASDYVSPEFPTTYPESRSACKTVTTRPLARLMRLLDRCPITPPGLEDLELLRREVLAYIDYIDAARMRHYVKIKIRARERFRRIRKPQCYEGTRPGIARGLSSQLSYYTAVEDADDPFGQRDARCETQDFGGWDFSPASDDVDWSR